jgi:DNA processing protein
LAAPADFEAWFRLLETPRLGRQNARRLLAAFGSPEAVLGARGPALKQVVPAPLVAALTGKPPEPFGQRLEAATRWLAGDAAHHALVLGDPAYPPRLLQSPDPPLLLFVRGSVEPLSRFSLAIVGSRFPSAQGAENARAFAAALSTQGLVIVSGLALGIDAAAHQGALEGSAPTVAVLGAGPEQPYPTRNAALAGRIVAAGGALVSEYPPGAPPLAEHFPERNRIIAALSLGTLVVEAALKSGSLITARLASEAGREVFAIPGSIHLPQAKGCHALIKQGAKLVEVATDILEELDLQDVAHSGTEPNAQAPREAETDPVLAALGHDPATLDALAARTGWGAAELSAHLLQLEFAGRLARLPGGLYQRIARA